LLNGLFDDNAAHDYNCPCAGGNLATSPFVGVNYYKLHHITTVCTYIYSNIKLVHSVYALTAEMVLCCTPLGVHKKWSLAAIFFLMHYSYIYTCASQQ